MSALQVFMQQERSIDLQRCAACLLTSCERLVREQSSHSNPAGGGGAITRLSGVGNKLGATGEACGSAWALEGSEEAQRARQREAASAARRARAKASQAAAQEHMRAQQAAFLQREEAASSHLDVVISFGVEGVFFASGGLQRPWLGARLEGPKAPRM